MGGGRRGGRERKREKARDNRSGKPDRESGSEERVGGAQGGRMSLETTMGELPPVGERGGIDLEIRKGVVSGGRGGTPGGMLTCLGEDMRFFDRGDKVRDIIH